MFLNEKCSENIDWISAELFGIQLTFLFSFSSHFFGVIDRLSAKVNRITPTYYLLLIFCNHFLDSPS